MKRFFRVFEIIFCFNFFLNFFLKTTKKNSIKTKHFNLYFYYDEIHKVAASLLTINLNLHNFFFRFLEMNLKIFYFVFEYGIDLI